MASHGHEQKRSSELLKYYFFFPSDKIQPEISFSTSGEMVSSMLNASEGLPVVQ
jgi:hypothetical protein